MKWSIKIHEIGFMRILTQLKLNLKPDENFFFSILYGLQGLFMFLLDQSDLKHNEAYGGIWSSVKKKNF